MDHPHELDVDFLDIICDEQFPEVKMLRIKLHGVLLFGSCMEFVDNMLKMLHVHHSEIFLQVTDFILDFQQGHVAVLDLSAAEAIQVTARILAKRGIRAHVKNMDSLTWACFDRVRRYFPDVCDDDVNNVKHHCYVRHLFQTTPRLEVQDAGVGTDRLDDNVFLRSNGTFARTTTAAGFLRGEELERGAGAPSVAPTPRSDDHVSQTPENDPRFMPTRGQRESLPSLGERANAEPMALSKRGKQESAFD